MCVRYLRMMTQNYKQIHVTLLLTGYFDLVGWANITWSARTASRLAISHQKLIYPCICYLVSTCGLIPKLLLLLLGCKLVVLSVPVSYTKCLL